MALPDQLSAVVSEFRTAPAGLRLELLLEYARKVPPVADQAALAGLERVDECQSPLYVGAVVGAGNIVSLRFEAPEEAPTTRGFAGILAAGLDGVKADDVLGVEDDFAHMLGLDEVISPLRLRGMTAMLARIKRQIRERP